MGGPCRIVAAGGGDGLLRSAEALVHRLEGSWSRFLATSEVSVINGNTGHATIVSPETYRLIELAEKARTWTGGLFNPLMLTQLEALGYSRPWSGDGPGGVPRPSSPGSLEGIVLLPEIPAVQIPAGTIFDPGGIGKGLAADLVTEFLTTEGATTSSVELGGDLRVGGVCWYAPTWRVGIAHPANRSGEIAAFTLEQGAVATSSVLRRKWSVGGRRLHHLLDPTNGLPAETDLVSVSATASSAWRAEVAAKVAVMAGSDGALDLLRSLGAAGIAVRADGFVLGATDGDLDHVQQRVTA